MTVVPDWWSRPLVLETERLHIRTFTGKTFYWDDVENNQFDICDIAHALAMNCRWTGHTRRFYSVAQHSVMVAENCPPEHAMAGLLHDAAEAYIHDTPTPLKLHLAEAGFTAFADLDARVDRAVFNAFNLSWPRHGSVKVADQRMLATEYRDLMKKQDQGEFKRCGVPYEPYPFFIYPMLPEEAEQLFLSTFYRLLKENTMSPIPDSYNRAPARTPAPAEKKVDAPRPTGAPFFAAAAHEDNVSLGDALCAAMDTLERHEDNLPREQTPAPKHTPLPTDAKARKDLPLCTGLLDYFPDALIAVAELSRIGNDQHNPGQELHWARGKSGDEANALLRHLVDRGSIDTDNVRHSTKVAWRALANLQKEIEADTGAGPSRGSR